MPYNTLSRSAGFGVVGVLVIIFALFLAGFIGWRVYDANQKPPSNVTAPAPNEVEDDPLPVTTTDPNVGYVFIKEWEVRFEPVEGLADVVYSVDGDKQAVVFSTVALSKYGQNCNANSTSHVPLGRLYRTRGDKDDALHLSTIYAAQVGDYYYQLTGPQSVCADNNSAIKLQTESLSLIKQSMQSLEVAE
jgi:hypothetical protein